eukprot:4416006-Pyramimonas_sp.AAC.1
MALTSNRQGAAWGRWLVSSVSRAATWAAVQRDVLMDKTIAKLFHRHARPLARNFSGASLAPERRGGVPRKSIDALMH